ncbi:MAG: pyridoxamine 5'-phosphate oxidase family protein [Cetobacterium sp.]
MRNEIDDLIQQRIYVNGVSKINVDLQKKFMKIVESCTDLTIATVREDGWPQANNVGFVNIGEDLYFETFKVASKAKNIARDPRVSITITPAYEKVTEALALSMAAIAEVVTDEKIINEFHIRLLKKIPELGEVVYPDGTKMFPDYDNTIIYRLKPIVASILDYKMGFGAADFVEFEDTNV